MLRRGERDNEFVSIVSIFVLLSSGLRFSISNSFIGYEKFEALFTFFDTVNLTIMLL